MESTPPGNPEEYATEGEILGRISARSMIAKDWNSLYWVMEENDLYLYRSKEVIFHNNFHLGGRRPSQKGMVLTYLLLIFNYIFFYLLTIRIFYNHQLVIATRRKYT